MKQLLTWTVVLLAVASAPSFADSTAARCDIYASGDDHADTMIGCTFSQRQGYVTIARDDGVTHELTPLADQPGSYHDQNGYAVERENGLGDQGLVFRFPAEAVYVYWNTAALNPAADEDNPTAPFSTTDYDATTLLRCRALGATESGSCPAGILRMDGGEASIVVQSPAGEQFTVNFMSDYVNATNRKAEARLEGDTWIVVIDDTDVYEVPLAAIEGG
jgi:hypothetical protein